jgi:hypothetical protein
MVVIMNVISDKTMVMLDENVVSCELDGEVAILNMNNGVYYGLNPIGALIWKLIEENSVNVTQITELVLTEYDVEKDLCRRDIFELLEELLKNGLVKIK